jgi:MFS family permease
MIQKESSVSRWWVLSLALLTIALVGGAARLCLPVLFKEISIDLNLDLVAVGTIWGLDSLAGFFVSLPGGLLLDRFGIKKSMVVVCFLAAIVCAARGLSGNFTGLAVTTFAFGMVAVLTLVVGPKVVSAHFRGRYLGLASSLLFVAQYAGQMLSTMTSATILSPLAGGWRNVLFLYAIPPVIMAALWWATRGSTIEPERHVQADSASGFKESLLHVAKIKEVWILGLVFFSQLGTLMAVNGYLPLYLRNMGWTPAAADSAFTLTLAASCIGTIPLSHLSDRVKSRKAVLISTIVVMSLLIASLFILREGLAVWVLLVVFGLVRGVPGVMANSLMIETKGVGSKYIGTAIGMMITVGMVGGFILPPVGNALAAIDPALPFLFWAFACLVFPAGLFFMKEPHRGPGKPA